MDALIGVLDGLTFWHWWGLAGVLLVLELLTGTTYLLWPVAAAALVGVLDVTPLQPSWQVQLAVFAAATALLTLFGDKLVAKRWRRLVSDKPHLNERAAQLRGQRVIAVAPFASGHGRVRLGDTVWAAVLESPAEVDQGAALEIVAVDGATLKVRVV